MEGGLYTDPVVCHYARLVAQRKAIARDATDRHARAIALVRADVVAMGDMFASAVSALALHGEGEPHDLARSFDGAPHGESNAVRRRAAHAGGKPHNLAKPSDDDVPPVTPHKR